MKVVFVGGGSGGPVAPLLAIYEQLKDAEPNLEAIWIGTAKGPEREMVNQYKIDFRIISGGKFRRYFSLQNFIDPFFTFVGFLQSIFILKKFKPDVVLSAGSFIAVPVVYAAWILKIPCFVHQQDLQKGLANSLMAKIATVITVAFADSVTNFDIKKTYHIGNPVRKSFFEGNKDRALKFFNLDANLKTILILGGGQGAEVINQTIMESLAELTKKYQIIHQTGVGKAIRDQIADYYDRQTQKQIESRYHDYEFFNEGMVDAYVISDLVVCRSGLGTLSEIAVLGKPALLIPIPGHQEQNAQYFLKFNAVKVLPQSELNKENLLKAIELLMSNPADLQGLARNIATLVNKDAAKSYVELIYKVINHNIR
jgi:UDP-N-acetylglucosamine--N-acetylmuramyl-(pentapeptide) pyrophosphoryl-undecaprenol N-acetylglucosamine transferase